MVSKISEYVMDKLEGEDTIYRSSDSVHKAVNWSDDSIFRRVPKQPKVSWNYKLKLNIGVPVMLLLNIARVLGYAIIKHFYPAFFCIILLWLNAVTAF
jgi:hypothetical protein